LFINRFPNQPVIFPFDAIQMRQRFRSENDGEPASPWHRLEL
jgi:hypothetical protein